MQKWLRIILFHLATPCAVALHSDSGLDHGTGFGQWDMSKHDTCKDLQTVCVWSLPSLTVVGSQPPCEKAQEEEASLLDDDSPMTQTHPVTPSQPPPNIRYLSEDTLDHPATINLPADHRCKSKPTTKLNNICCFKPLTLWGGLLHSNS